MWDELILIIEIGGIKVAETVQVWSQTLSCGLEFLIQSHLSHVIHAIIDCQLDYTWN